MLCLYLHVYLSFSPIVSTSGSEDETPRRLPKKGKKMQSAQPGRSPRKTRKAATKIKYNFDDSEDSDVEFVEATNRNDDSSDYVPPISAESTEEPGSSLQEIDDDELSPAARGKMLTPRNNKQKSVSKFCN